MTTSVESTTTLLPDPSQNGGQLRRSERAVVRQAIPTDFGCSEETVRALTALLCGLSAETLSGDVMALAIMRAKDLALENGVTEAEFNRVGKLILVDWRKNRHRNPLSNLF